MRLVVQRVTKAGVRVVEKNITSGSIGQGLFVLVGIGKDDTKEKAASIAKKLVKLRILSDENGKMNLSLKDTGRQLLVVSQFTLYADTKDGNRPSFINAAEPKLALEIYDYFVECLKEFGLKVATGEFGAYMSIDAQLDGPVTIIMEE
jgi:D-aminoacyl-tRNA deacylase